MLQVDVHSELVLVKEMSVAKRAERMQESDVAELINISLLQMSA